MIAPVFWKGKKSAEQEIALQSSHHCKNASDKGGGGDNTHICGYVDGSIRALFAGWKSTAIAITIDLSARTTTADRVSCIITMVY